MEEPGHNPAAGEGTPQRGLGAAFRRSNKKVLVVVAMVVIAIASLMATNLGGALTYYKTVGELKAQGPQAYGQRFRVGGRVLRGTVQKDAANNLTFVLYHKQTDDGLPVHYKGIVPDLFAEELDVIVEGRWQADGTFYAAQLLAQHPPEFKVAQPGKPHAPVEDRDYRQ